MSAKARVAKAWQTRLHLFVGVVTVMGAVPLAWVVATSDYGRLPGDRPAAFWTFAVLLVVAELRPLKWLRRRDGGDITASWAYACALLLVTPGGGALLVMAAASVCGDLAHRKSLVKTAFNAAQVTLSLAAGALILDAAGMRAHLLVGDQVSPWFLPAIALTGLAVFVSNSVLTCTVIALHTQAPVWATIRRDVRRNASTDGMLLALAPIFVVVADRSLVLLPLLLVTSYAVYSSARIALARQHEATHDSLTDLPNRRLFTEQVQTTIVEASRRGSRAAVVLLDLDGFKAINDRLGHHVGDRVLEVVGQRLREAARSTDEVARLGGDEFAILLRNLGQDADAHSLVERLRRRIDRPFTVEGFPLTIGGSFGIAMYPEHGNDAQELTQHADVAMYAAKSLGGGIVPYTSDAPARAGHGRLSLLSELHTAIGAGQLSLVYQPKVDIRARKIVGVEALLRWDHPTLGLVAPDEFMPLAEHTELMGPLTELVLQRSLEDCADWHRRGLGVSVAVNLSARNLHDLRFPRTVGRLLVEAGLEPGWLELEITENTVMADLTRSMTVLRELGELGVTLSVDDFGTGYSSLANLRDLPVHAVKIDRSFVSSMCSRTGDAVIVRSIIELARNLSLRTVAEGVEDRATWNALEQLGCDVVQGFYVSRPLTAADLVEWLEHFEMPVSFPLTRPEVA